MGKLLIWTGCCYRQVGDMGRVLIWQGVDVAGC